MASAEGGSVSSGVAYGEGCPLSSRLRGLGSVVSSPQWGPGRSPSRKRILAYFEGHRTLIFVLIWRNLGGTICPNSGGTCPPVPPVIYAHAGWLVTYRDKCPSYVLIFSEICDIVKRKLAYAGHVSGLDALQVLVGRFEWKNNSSICIAP